MKWSHDSIPRWGYILFAILVVFFGWRAFVHRKSQAKWRTLLHLYRAETPLTQAEVASRLGIEEPTLVSLLHRLERAGWIARKTAEHDRRCKTVHLGPRAQQAIERINDTAVNLRQE